MLFLIFTKSNIYPLIYINIKDNFSYFHFFYFYPIIFFIIFYYKFEIILIYFKLLKFSPSDIINKIFFINNKFFSKIKLLFLLKKLFNL